MKSGTHFHFKQFSVRHDRCAMKVGTDAVLLGAWADVAGSQNVLDIGTGSGVIALMLAQRTPPATRIRSVEIEREAADQAAENFRNSPWSSRIEVEPIAIQDYFPSTRHDLIVTNPPYFNRSLASPDQRRQQVRHTATLTHDDLLAAIGRLLTKNGRFNIILPFHEASLFSDAALERELFCHRRYHFRTRKDKMVERTLMEFGFKNQSTQEGEILLYEHSQVWSSSYLDLTSDFYLDR